ncbi:MAG: hypothetical protein F6K65_23740 [Moorea sp. SIO3C2]|nr:hypothetical protein [Moorena sp. SIO3C2]
MAKRPRSLDAVAHGGNHGSCSWGEPPLAALPPQDRLGALSALRIKFATGRTSASLREQGIFTKFYP